jgi:tetratricopeptide (TPR) repeat protein
MKRAFAALTAVALLATAAAPQSRLDQAVGKAEEQLAKGRPEDAVRTLIRAAADAGAEGQLALGRLQERLGSLDAAAQAYDKARALAGGPGRAEVLAAVANFRLRRGKAEDAMAIARDAVAAGPTPSALAALARAQVRMGDGPAALATAQKAAAAGEGGVLARVALGEALLALGRNAEAEVAFRQAVQLDPRSALARSRLARAQIALDRPAEAVASARRATELDDKLGEGFAVLGVAMVTQDAKTWGDAIALAQQGAFLDPEDPIVHEAVGKVFEVNGQLEPAVMAYRRARTVDPAYRPARDALVRAELARGHREGAIAEATTAGAEGAGSPDVDRLIGEDALRHQDAAGAIPFLERATRGVPDDPDGWALLGRAYHAMGRYDVAVEAYGKAVGLAPQNLAHRSTWGLVLGQAGQLDAGLEELRKVTGTPGYEDAAGWTNLGWIYRNLNRPQESIAAYRKALELDPKQEQAALGLGWAYSYTRDYDKAIEAYDEAIRIDPREAGPDANLGIAWSCYFRAVKNASREDAAAAKEAAAKAGAAGRNVAPVNQKIAELEAALARGLRISREQVEAAQKSQEESEEQRRRFAAANRDLGAKAPASRIRGIAAVVSLVGPNAVPTLTSLMQRDESYDVRIAACQALGSLGSAARAALPNIDGILRQDPYNPGIDAPPERLELQMKDGDYRRCLRDAKVKIGP